MQETHSLLISDARGIPSLQLMVNKHKTFEAALQITNTMRSTAQIQILGSNLLSRASRKIPHNTLQNKSVGGFLLSQVVDSANKLTGWMARFNGVATKYLQQYWNWYRAEVNCPDFDHFRNECFGYRKLAYYRQVSGS